MNKAKIISNIAKEANISKKDAQKAFELVFENIEIGLREGNVVIPSFGTFKTSERKERQGRNPLTGETITISAKTVVQFKPSSVLKEKFNN